MNRHTDSQDKSHSQPQPAQPRRNPTHSAKNQRSQRSSAEEREPEATEQVEGEGSYTATHRYNEGLKEHLRTHDVESEAEEAREALEGDERTELEQAEQRGKRRAAEQPSSQGPSTKH